MNDFRALIWKGEVRGNSYPVFIRSIYKMYVQTELSNLELDIEMQALRWDGIEMYMTTIFRSSNSVYFSCITVNNQYPAAKLRWCDEPQLCEYPHWTRRPTVGPSKLGIILCRTLHPCRWNSHGHCDRRRWFLRNVFPTNTRRTICPSRIDGWPGAWNLR